MRYLGRHERKSNFGWVVISWLFTVGLLSTTYFYAITEPNNFGWIVWLCVGGLWLIVALKVTKKYCTIRE